MLFINRLVLVGLLGVGIIAATSAQGGTVQLFTAQWYAEGFGNECKLATPNGTTFMTPGGGPATKCTRTTPDFTKYSNFVLPQGQNCNELQPRCPISSTPTGGPPQSSWSPLGGLTPMATGAHCGVPKATS